jgi:LPS export ABC transporter protein LptC
VRESTTKKVDKYHFRASIPKYFRYGAVGALAVVLIVVGIALYRGSGDPDFRMKGFPSSLSKDVVATVEGYERREMEGDTLKYFISADRAVTFADDHQELENVLLRVMTPDGTGSDEIKARKAVYVPAEEKNFTVYFAGDVNIDTRDRLAVSTQNLTYERSSDIAKAEEAVAFSRDNIRGSSIGAVVNAAEKRVELLNSVSIETLGPSQPGDPAVKPTLINASYAAYDQMRELIELSGDVHVRSADSVPAAERIDIRSARANAELARLGEKLDVRQVELFENVQIRSGADTRMASNYAVYQRPAERFEMRGAVHIATNSDAAQTDFRAQAAVYEQLKQLVSLSGGVEITRGGDLVNGDTVVALLYGNQKLKKVDVNGNGLVRQVNAERTFEVTGPKIIAMFDPQQDLTSSDVLGNASATLVPVTAGSYSKVTLGAPNALRAKFRPGGLMETVSTEGRTVIHMHAPANDPQGANRRVTADTVRSVFSPDGKFLSRAEAVGKAELFIEPVTAAPDRYRTTVTAPRFDCDFFATGNNARTCDAGLKAVTVRDPMVASAGRGRQTLSSDKMSVRFNESTRDAELLTAAGNSKFSELARNATANTFEYNVSEQIVRLRGGEPTAWDDRARAKAAEIDWDTKNQQSALRGNVSTTYYSQKATGGATPFSGSNRPVYITSGQANIDHAAETAVYHGNARAWQDDNYLRAETISINQKESRLSAQGGVQSMLTRVAAGSGTSAKQPVHASGARMSYVRASGLLRYEEGVEIRQGSDRITGAVANIYLDDKNELSQTVVENQVVITQPGRKATGDYAQYIAANETVLLRGRPARINDAERGSSEGAEVLVYMREDRVVGQGKSERDPSGRIRSVFKVKND